MSAPKVGDRVRLTTKGGENTVEGEYRGKGNGLWSVKLSGSIAINAFNTEDWNIEVIEPTTLERVRALKPGAVIHNGVGDHVLLVRTTSGNWAFVHSNGTTIGVGEREVAGYLDRDYGPDWEVKYEGHDVS